MSCQLQTFARMFSKQGEINQCW